MKKILLGIMALSSFQALAQLRGINPPKVKQSPFYLYKNLQIDEVKNKVKVLGFSYSKSGRDIYIDPNGNNQVIDLDKFIFYRRLGSSSFEATAGSGTAVGTAFLVGKDFVLTNKHVAETDNAKKECNHFAVTLESSPRQEVTCKKVWYCDTHDFCLIEMNKTKENLSLGDFTPPLSLSSNLAKPGSSIYLIGNSHALGVQGSEGKDFTYVDRIKEVGQELAMKYYANSLYDLNFFAPSLGGSSGSPIYDNAGTLVGINYAHSSITGSAVGEDVTNHAVPAYYIISQLKKVLPGSILNQINFNKNNLEKEELYRSQWLAALKESKKEFKFDFKLLFECIDEENYKPCEEEISSSYNLNVLKNKFSMLSTVELNKMDWPQIKLTQALKEIASVGKNLSIDYFDVQALRKACANEKNLTDKCITKKQIAMNLAKLPYFSKIIASYNSNEVEQIISSISMHAKKITTDYYFEIQNIVHSNKKLNGQFYKECLKATDKLFIQDVLFDGYSTPLYADKCTELSIEVMKIAGYTIEGSDFSDLKMAVQSSPLISAMNESFKTMVLKKWKVFINQPLKSKETRHKANVKLLKDWIQSEKIELDENELYDLINSKFRFFYL
jgi:S1-C subfamily serine protease